MAPETLPTPAPEILKQQAAVERPKAEALRIVEETRQEMGLSDPEQFRRAALSKVPEQAPEVREQVEEIVDALRLDASDLLEGFDAEFPDDASGPLEPSDEPKRNPEPVLATAA